MVTDIVFRVALSSLCCRKGDPFQGLKVGSCLTLRNESSEETDVLTKQEIFLGGSAQVESRRTALLSGMRVPALHVAHGLQFLVIGSVLDCL